MPKNLFPLDNTKKFTDQKCVGHNRWHPDIPPAVSVRTRFAVSVVTCRQAATRRPASGFSRAKRSRIAAKVTVMVIGHHDKTGPLGWGVNRVLDVSVQDVLPDRSLWRRSFRS